MRLLQREYSSAYSLERQPDGETQQARALTRAEPDGAPRRPA
jgi:hypothetical protein